MQDNGCIRRLLFALCINDWSGGLNLIVALPPKKVANGVGCLKITNICFAHVNVLSETHINLRFLRNNPIQTKGILQENSSCVLSFRAEKDMLLWW